MFNKLRNLDANPKTLEEFKVRTYQGGILSVIAFIIIGFLFVAELTYYYDIEIVHKMSVDEYRDRKITINFNITFPRMPCSLISIEANDMAGNEQEDVDHQITKTRLDLEGSPIDRSQLETIGGALKNYSHLMEDSMENREVKCGSCYNAGKPGECCNSCDDVKNAYKNKKWALPSLHSIEQCMESTFEDIVRGKISEGCSIEGFLLVSKVPGKIAFAPGKIFQKGYLHVEDLVEFTFKAFDNSHVINILNFGEIYPNMKKPLDGRVKNLPESSQGVYQYFLKVVPTEFYYLNGKHIITNQYSVTENFHQMSASKRQGLPGVVLSYEFSPIMFRDEEQQKGFLQFLVGACAIIGGTFTVMGMVDSFIFSLTNRFKRVPLK